MSLISEYIQLIKKGLKNKDKIIEALQLQVAIRNKDYENITPGALAEIIRRRDICNACEFYSKNAVEAGWYKTKLNFGHCTHCTCPVGGDLDQYGKEYALSAECGIAIYNNRNPQNQMELKWKAFEPTDFKSE